MPRPVHFEIHCDDIARAQQFYADIFGWTYQEMGGPMEYVLVTTGPDDERGINGGMLKRKLPIDGEAVIAYVNTVGVADIGATEAAVKSAGGEQVTPRVAIPTYGWLSYFKDTEGNIFGAMQPDEQAA